MPTILELKEERKALFVQMRGILDKADAEKRPLTAEERQEYDRLEADALRSLGWKVGMFNHLRFNHLGICFSTATYNESGWHDRSVPV